MNYKKYQSYQKSNVDWLGDIPAHWNFVKLKYVITLQKGKNPQHFSEDKKYLPYLTMDYLRGKTDEPIYAVPQSNLVEAQDKDLLILWDGANAGEIIQAKQGYVSSTMAVINVKNLLLNKEYLFFYLKWLEKTLKKFAGGTTIPHLDTTILLNQKYALPPLTEQIAIAAYLDHKLADIDTFIAKKQRLITLLQEQKTAMINKAVTKGLNEQEMRPSGIAWLGDIPTHWEVRKLKYVAETLRGKFTPRPRHDPRYYDGNYPFIQTGNISAANKYIETYNQTLNELGKEVSKEFPPNTVVMSIAANIADVAILTFNACFPDSIVGFKPFNVVEVDFLYYQLKNLRSEFYRIATKNTQYNLNVERVQNVKFVLPPLTEQIAIVSHIEAESARIDKAISLIERELTLVQEYRTALIAEAVTGKIKCPDVEQGQSIPS